MGYILLEIMVSVLPKNMLETENVPFLKYSFTYSSKTLTVFLHVCWNTSIFSRSKIYHILHARNYIHFLPFLHFHIP